MRDGEEVGNYRSEDGVGEWGTGVGVEGQEER